MAVCDFDPPRELLFRSKDKPNVSRSSLTATYHNNILADFTRDKCTLHVYPVS